MPAILEDFEIEEPATFPIENWRVDQQKETLHLKERENTIVWEQVSSLKQPSDIENALRKLVADSGEILKCRDDSDDGFVAYSNETLDRAIRFLTAYIKLATGTLGVGVPIPRLLPGPSGSIDVHWKNENKELIVNIPADRKALALFYGDDYGKLFIKGSLDTTSLHPSVLMWLLNS